MQKRQWRAKNKVAKVSKKPKLQKTKTPLAAVQPKVEGIQHAISSNFKAKAEYNIIETEATKGAAKVDNKNVIVSGVYSF